MKKKKRNALEGSVSESAGIFSVFGYLPRSVDKFPDQLQVQKKGKRILLSTTTCYNTSTEWSVRATEHNGTWVI